MNLPSISIVCPTYVRTTLLVELVESFQRQDYQGPLELLIVNDCEDQQLTCSVPGVRVQNLAPFADFGSKKNHAVRATDGALLMVWDDDDIYLPSAVSSLVNKLQTEEAFDGLEHRCARLRTMFQWTGGDTLCRVSASFQHTTLFRRSAFEEAGGWSPLEAGRADREFWARVCRRWFAGRWFHEQDGIMQAIHRADTDRPHLVGSDPPPFTQAEYQERARARMRSGEEPTGTVDLVPSWSRDWQALADATPTDCQCTQGTESKQP